MENKIALITGGSRGLGKDMALALARSGVGVVLTYLGQREAAEQTKIEIEHAGAKAAVLQLDTGSTKSFDAFVQNLVNALRQTWNTERLDFLVHNAGIGATLMIPQVTEDDFDRLTNIHFKGPYFLTQKLLPLMNDGGGIVFISTGTTRTVNPGYSVYASLKGAVEVLTRYVAAEAGARGIRSNVVAPGAIVTDFNNALLRSNPDRQKMIAGRTALGRVGQADDIGGVVAFLCSKEAKWINGQRIEVSGGINL